MKRTLTVLLFTSILFYSCSFFAAGSYPYAEGYVIDASEKDVLKAVQFFRLQNPQYNVPDSITLHGNHVTLTEGQRSHWYYLYFYDKTKKQIYFTWIRESIPRGNFGGELDTIPETTFALFGVLTGFKLGVDENYGDINKDFSRKQNKYYKRRFEELYLDKIKAIVKRK